MTVTSRLLHLLLPAPCLGCTAPLPPAAAPFALCLPCRGRLRRHVPGCPRCGRPLPGRRRLPAPCTACRRRAPACARLLSPWSYEPPLDAVVQALKFRRHRHLGEHLAAPLAAWLTTGAPDGGGLGAGEMDLVTPVPLQPWRHLRRGYNQAAVLARPLARHLGLPCRGLLLRPLPATPQSRLSREERRTNVHRAFLLRPGAARHAAGRRLLLVDDVATTGATLEAAARALRRAGAAAVTAVTLARTPAPVGPPEGAGAGSSH